VSAVKMRARVLSATSIQVNFMIVPSAAILLKVHIICKNR